MMKMPTCVPHVNASERPREIPYKQQSQLYFLQQGRLNHEEQWTMPIKRSRGITVGLGLMLMDFRDGPRKWMSHSQECMLSETGNWGGLELSLARTQQPLQWAERGDCWVSFAVAQGLRFLCHCCLNFWCSMVIEWSWSVLTLSHSIFAQCWCSTKLCSVRMYSLRPTTSCQHSALSFSFSHRKVLTLHYQVRHANYQAFLSRVDLKKIMIICFENPLQINVF